jgi:hypothetical protein
MLDAISSDFGGDKSTRGHGYTLWYEKHLASRRDSVKSILEIGIGDGPSLELWAAWFPDAKIIGVDNEPRIVNEPDERAIRVLATQDAPRELAQAVSEWAPYDLIVDDGSHRWSHQVNTFHALWPLLKPGGLYVIEDLHTSYWQDYAGGSQTCVQFLTKLVDEINLLGRSDTAILRNSASGRALAPTLGSFQKELLSVHFYRSIAFIDKATEEEMALMSET